MPTLWALSKFGWAWNLIRNYALFQFFPPQDRDNLRGPPEDGDEDDGLADWQAEEGGGEEEGGRGEEEEVKEDDEEEKEDDEEEGGGAKKKRKEYMDVDEAEVNWHSVPNLAN